MCVPANANDVFMLGEKPGGEGEEMEEMDAGVDGMSAVLWNMRRRKQNSILYEAPRREEEYTHLVQN